MVSDPIAELLLLDAARRGVKYARMMQAQRNDMIGQGMILWSLGDEMLADDIDFIDCAIDAYERATKDPTDDD